MKRLFDIIVSGFGILALSPVFILVSLLIKLDSKGPVFYRQRRVGRGGKDFDILKFRSMRVGSDKGTLVTIGERDPRITQMGYYLRKFKIDEIPQLINVFVGDMSLVGPRPEVRRYVDLYTPEQMRVLDVRPGITDKASIQYRNENGILGNVDDPETYYVKVIMPDKLRINLEYVDHHNVWVDIKLLFETLWAVVAE